jgi:biopolymer transport protein ExbB
VKRCQLRHGAQRRSRIIRAGLALDVNGCKAAETKERRRDSSRFSRRAAAPSLGILLFSIIQAAGWPIWPLILCSVVALAIVFERFVSLRASQIAPAGLLDEVLAFSRDRLPNADVLNKLAQNSEMGSVLAAGMRAASGDARVQETDLRQAMEAAGRMALHRMERYLSPLGSIASAAPLLGLFGTVVGMIEIFGSQSPTGSSNPQMLAHGISIALYNTAFGLIIAIPALIFYRHFRTRVDEYQLAMELGAERLLQHLLRQNPRAAAS